MLFMKFEYALDKFNTFNTFFKFNTRLPMVLKIQKVGF